MFPPYPALPVSPQPRGLPRGTQGGIGVRYPELAVGTQFDGVNDFAEASGLGLGAPAEFTAMGWVRPTASGNNVIFDSTASFGANGFTLLYNAGALSLVSYGVGGVSVTSTTLVVGTRYHLAFVASGGFATVYVDGVRASAVTSIPVGNRPTSHTRQRFGANTSGAQPFQGQLSAWSVFSRALSEAEIEQAARTRSIYPSLDSVIAIYPFDQLNPTATQSPDISGNARHLTLTNMPANPIAAF
jgi:hypothetical protein